MAIAAMPAKQKPKAEFSTDLAIVAHNRTKSGAVNDDPSAQDWVAPETVAAAFKVVSPRTGHAHTFKRNEDDAPAATSPQVEIRF